MTTLARQGFQLIHSTELHESKQNPRRHFDKAGLDELADSIAQVGIVTPLIVRPNAKGFEIAAGHRRFRAAKQAGLAELPCLVRELTDEQFLEILTIENLQREDLHPLDEARGFESLMAPPHRWKVEQVAEKVGKSVKYVYDRVKLLELAPELQDLFLEDKFTAGHAILLARLTKDDQLRCLGHEINDYCDGGLFTVEYVLYDPSLEGDDGQADEPTRAIKPCSVRELEAWINQHVRFDRTNVDAMIFPKTAKAIEQQVADERQSGDTADATPLHAVVPITYAYVLGDDVLDRNDRTLTIRSWKRADGRRGTKICEHAVLGCVVFGVHRGETFKVCIDKKTCNTHWGEEIRARAKREKERANNPGGAADRERKEKDREAAKRAAEEARHQRWQTAKAGIQKDVAAKIASMPIGALISGYLGTDLVQSVKGWQTTPAIAAMVKPGKGAEAFLRHLAWLHVADELGYEGRGAGILKGLQLKVDELLDKHAPQKVQTSAKAETAPGRKKAKR